MCKNVDVSLRNRVELKLAPKTPAIELAMKHFGMFAPEAQKVKYSLDWDTLLSRDEDAVDPIEARIEQEGRDIPQPRT